MEKEEVVKLINILSKKDHYPFTITGKDDDGDGKFTIILDRQYKLNEDANYIIQLKDFVGWANFPNVDDTNNKFYYKTSNVPNTPVKSITVPSGSYQLKDYNDYIKKVITANGDNSTNITIEGYINQQNTNIILKGGYQVLFSKPNTWRLRLGFNAVDLTTNGERLSQHSANIMDVLIIFIHCSLASGYSVNGKMTNVLYTIANDFEPGSVISLKYNKNIRCSVNQKTFNEITIWFTDQEFRPLTFAKDTLSVEVAVDQD